MRAEGTFFKYRTEAEIEGKPKWLQESIRRYDARMRAFEESYTREELERMRGELEARAQDEVDRQRLFDLEQRGIGRRSKKFSKVEFFLAEWELKNRIATQEEHSLERRKAELAQVVARHFGQKGPRAVARVRDVFEMHGGIATRRGVEELLVEGVSADKGLRWLEARARNYSEKGVKV